MLIRPQQKRQQAQRQLREHLDPGDDIVTIGGMYGTVIEIDDDEGTILLEVAPNVEIRMMKQSVMRRLVEEEDDPDAVADDASSDDHSPALGDGAKPSATRRRRPAVTDAAQQAQVARDPEAVEAAATPS